MTKVVTKAENYLKNGETILTIITQWGEVLMDLSKAFDTVNHSILFDKLEHYGIRGLALKWIKSYFSNRLQFVEYNGYVSSRANIMCGVP